MCRSLQVGVPSNSLSLALAELSDSVEIERQLDWLDLVEREHAYIMALARLEAEDRKAQRGKVLEIDKETGEVTG